MSDPATWLASTLGALCVGLGVWETFMAVLHPRAVVGPVTSTVNHSFHRVFRYKAITASRVVLFSGPLLILGHIVCWATLLLLGFSLISWPQLGSGITSSDGQPTDDGFVTAIYYAGYTLTTLGTGDLVPRSNFMRVITITAAGIGFGFFTLVLAYVISVYGTLKKRNQFACEISYRTGRSGQTAAYLQPYLQSGDLSLLYQDLTALTSGLADLLESHHFYPALHYFRFDERRYAMSQMLRFCLEVASALRTLHLLDANLLMLPSEPLDRLWHAGLQMLEDANKHFVICQPTDEDRDDAFVNDLYAVFDVTSRFAGRVDRVEFVREYDAQCLVWKKGLRALEICTGSSTRSEVCD